ncbi:MAG: Y-family DNA polymerase [Candidatus Dojkabacteria bacterium]
MSKLYALLDCNNFYASCERIFNPKLNGKPVVILSNNDGCIIARSNEAKALGIPMGAPIHMWQHLIDRYDMYVFSSNFTLYGDISKRVMMILKEYSPDIEVYSIDEAFLNLEFVKTDNVEEYCKAIVKRIQKEVGIPTSIGISETKTLAKLGNKVAKKNYIATQGVFWIHSEQENKELLSNIEVEDTWGIGRKYSLKLNYSGVYSVYDFKKMDRLLVKAKLGVGGERTYLEINGVNCVEMDHHVARKSVISSRSFGKNVVSLEELEEAVATFMSIAGEKLRGQGSMASYVGVSIKSAGDIDKEEKRYKFDFLGATLDAPSDYTPTLIKAAKKTLRQLYQPNLKYRKAGVLLTGIIPKIGYAQMTLDNKQNEEEREGLMEAVDEVNNEWGREVIKVAATGIKQSWRGRKNRISNRFTTEWGELLEVKI